MLTRLLLHGALITMEKADKKLGMERPITRRDMLQGFGILTGSVLLPSLSNSAEKSLFSSVNRLDIETQSNVYPPALTGMRGNHDGSFDTMHALVRSARQAKSAQPVDAVAFALEKDTYDMIVVGAGISGLASAHFYLKEFPQAKILILDNHDDFGGHAKRNEFEVNGRNIITYAGSSYLVSPSGYSAVVKGLLDDLNINLDRFEHTFDQEFYRRNGLAGGFHFNKQKWGVDLVVPFSGIFANDQLLASPNISLEESVDQLPISEAAKTEFLRLFTTTEDQIPHITAENKYSYLTNLSYRDFLTNDIGITEPEIFEILQDLAVDPGLGIEAVDAYAALSYSGLPGWNAAGLPSSEEAVSPAIHRFPDGNASIARLLVRLMIPESASGNTMDDIVTAKFDYGKLDSAGSNIRLRLNSTVTNVQHSDTSDSSKPVEIAYTKDGQSYQVKARNCVLACNNSVIPYICPSLPEAQKEALAEQVKQPIIFSRVAIRNWHAMKELGIGRVYSPGSYHIGVQIAYPVSFEGYDFSEDSSEPIVLNMYRFPHVNNLGLSPQEQYRQARAEILNTTFEDIERNIREQLDSLFNGTDFNSREDIVGITVNRWAHGYAYDLSSHLLFDTVYEDYDDERYAHVRGRKPFGHIAIANADSGASAMLESAVEQGYRAVNEILAL